MEAEWRRRRLGSERRRHGRQQHWQRHCVALPNLMFNNIGIQVFLTRIQNMIFKSFSIFLLPIYKFGFRILPIFAVLALLCLLRSRAGGGILVVFVCFAGWLAVLGGASPNSGLL